jgi:hypothetical protein
MSMRHLTRRRRLRLPPLAALCVALLVSACLEMPRAQDTSLLTRSEECQPPCWHGIVPGHTTAHEAIGILRGIEFVDPQTVERATWSTGEVIEWRNRDNPRRVEDGRLKLEGEVVKDVIVVYPSGLPLGDILAAQGEPEWVVVGLSAESTNFGIDFFYKRGLMLKGLSPVLGNRQSLTVTSSIRVVQAAYFPPMRLADYWARIVGVTPDSAARRTANYQPWPGLGGVVERR